MEKRQYKLKQRAEQQAQTRDRIVQATMELHEELGPRETTISAIASRAGVQRLTVYRHFPDDRALFQACTAHWISLHPLPDLSQWADIPSPAERCRAALLAFYGYYRRTEVMWTKSYRDLDEVPALKVPMAAVESYLGDVKQNLAAVWQAEERSQPELLATIGHGLRFPTWQSLHQEGLDENAMAELVTTWITTSAEASGASEAL